MHLDIVHCLIHGQKDNKCMESHWCSGSVFWGANRYLCKSLREIFRSFVAPGS